MESLQGLIGIPLLLALAWAVSENRRAFPWRAALVALALQFAIAWVMFSLPLAKDFFVALNDAVTALQAATKAGTTLVFGYLGGGALPFAEPYPGAAFILAFQALPLILVISALSALLWHWRILPRLVAGIAWGLERTLGIGGAAGLSAAANIFVGMVEAPLLVRPLLARLSRADLFLVMTCGMATIAGTVMVLYATLLQGVVEDPVGHILTASIISVPAAILIARVMVPPDKAAESAADGSTPFPPSDYSGAMEAITRGTEAGLKLLLSVCAFLVVLVALVALVDQILLLLPDWGNAPITLERLMGLLFRPVVWAIGVPWAEAETAGALFGTKTILNEFVAYLNFSALPPEALSARSRVILLYALCGFANPGSLGIMIGGLVAMAPERRADIAALGPRTILSGTLATAMTGAVVGLLVG